MASIIVSVVLAFLVAVAILHLIGMRKTACWLLTVIPAFLCAQGLMDISRGVAKLGEASYRSDEKGLTYSFGLLALSLFAAFRPNSPWLFWMVWVFDIAVCGILVHLVFFWKPFS